MNQSENANSEEWRTINDHSRYMVSTLGRVKNKDTGRILKASKNKTAGYVYIRLYSDSGKQTNFRLHRLVALHFLDNPENKPEVNHIDEDKTNNALSNLEWCTRKENVRYGTGISRRTHSLSIPILCSNGLVYNSLSECARALQLSSGSISEVLSGKRKHTRGYRFERVDNIE